MKRAPTQPLVVLPHTLSELTAPMFGYGDIKPTDNDLTKQHKGEPLGERIVVSGRVLDENSRPLPGILIEIWQANAAGRYNHRVDQHDAPLDPNFTGAGRVLTDAEGRYRFMTIRPGEYPWRNHYNAWRPAHIHFSLFGPAIVQRLITQMYFSGRPAARVRPDVHLRAGSEGAQPPDLHFRLGDHAARVRARLPLRHRAARARGDADGEPPMSLRGTTSQTIGPYLRIGLEWMVIEDLAPQGGAGERVRIEGRVLDGDGKPVNDAVVEIWQANSHGKYASPEDAQAKPIEQGFRGYGRSLTDDAGAFRFRTIKPGPRARPRRQAAGAAHYGHHLHAWAAEAASDPHLLSRRSGQRRRPGAEPHPR